jgi:alpha-aminoadipic semialdehyde synthase
LKILLNQVHGKELLQSAAPFLDAWTDLHLECLPNRDSLHYEKTYGIEGVATLFRGTLRYRGFSSLMNTFQNMGLFDETLRIDDLSTWKDALELLRLRGGFRSVDDFLLVCSQDDSEDSARAKECLEWLGMLNSTERLDSYFPNRPPIVDLFCAQLEKKLKYEKNERDMVIMHHSIGAVFDGGKKEYHSSSLRVFGDRAMTAMCKTVGQTTAASAELLINGTLQGHNLRGLVLPTRKEIYMPVLDAVKREGIKFDENVELEDNVHRVA